MAEEWSDTWEYQGKTFIRHLKCDKAMLEENKATHECPGPSGEPAKPDAQKTVGDAKGSQATTDDITNTGVEIMRKCFEEVGTITGRKPVQGDDVRMVNSLFIFITREMSRK